MNETNSYIFCSLSGHVYNLELSIPSTSIYEIRKYSKKNLPKGKSIFLCDGFEILCSNIKSHRVNTGFLLSAFCYCFKSLLLSLTRVNVFSAVLHWTSKLF